MKLLMIKAPGGHLVPADDEAREVLAGVENGEEVAVEFTRPRNLRFHKKFFAMLGFAFDHWEPHIDGVPQALLVKNRDRFRADVMIMAGFYDMVADLRGNVTPVARSISFAKMGEDEFRVVYQKVLTVIWNRVFAGSRYKSREELESVLNQLEGYA